MMTTRREQGARRLVVICGLAMVLASQVASGMPLDQSAQDNHIIARSPTSLQGYKQQLLGRLTSPIVDDNAPRKRQLNQEALGLVNDVIVTVAASAAASSATRAAAVKTVIVAASSKAAIHTAAAVTSSAPASTASVVASSSSPSTSTSSSSISLPAVTPVASASEITSTIGNTSTSGASTSTSTSSTSSEASKSFFNVHNKLFPAAVAAIVGIVVGVMLILITIGKCYAHAHMTPEEKAGEYGDYYKTSKNGGIAVRGAKSLRRAFTSKKLGSFARRNQEGTVLIDVGDEVYAVTAAVAQEYERERSALGGSSGGSRLTHSSSTSSPLRQALKNAEMNVAASQVGGRGRPTSQQLVQTWRDNHGQNNDEVLSRSISQKLTDGLRAFRGKPFYQASFSNGPEAYSFDSEKQNMDSMRQAEVPPTAYLPVITRGAKEWDIRPRQENDQYMQNHHALQSKSSTSSSSHSSSDLSHERHTLTDAPVPRPQSQPPSQQQQPQRQNQPRPKSILIKRDDQRDAGRQQRKPAPSEETGVQRTKTNSNRMSSKPMNSSTSAASPRMLQQRSALTGSHNSVAVILQPSRPSSSQSNAPQTRDLFRPLPGLPPTAGQS